MPLSEQFPTDPYVILDPAIRWYPGDELLMTEARGKLIPPLVEKVRQGVQAWRDKNYAGASDTTLALLRWWFNEEHLIPQADGTVAPIPLVFRAARGGGIDDLALLSTVSTRGTN